ncbi:MAG: LysR family transcriptional regulator [Betaproteobacteria bacterium]
MVDRFQAISAFARVVEAGSFVRAAERLGMSVSAVSRQVSELESHLDSRLLNRTTRRLSLTESGRVFYERCVQLLSDLEEAEQSAGAGTVRPRGTLRLTCGTTFGERHLAGAVAEFLQRYPEMRLDIELSDRTTDLVDEGFDAALRIGAIGSQNLVGRRVGQTRLVCCAAPAYLARHGEPRTPEALSGHACLTYEYLPHKNLWPFRDPDGSDRPMRVGGPVNANHGNFLAEIAVAGAGIVLEPDFVVGPDVRAGRLRPILRKFEPQPASIYVVYPSRRHLSAKVRALAEFLSARFAVPEWSLDTPKAPPRPRKATVRAS